MINQIQSTNNINFLGYKTKFSKQLEKFIAEPCPEPQAMIMLSQDMAKMVNKRVQPKYKMGEGKFHDVYKIDDYYVMRVPKDDRNPYVSLPRKPRKKVFEFFSGFKAYMGQVVSNFGDYEIIKNAKGTKKDIIEAGIPYKLAYKIDRCATSKEINDVQAQITKEYNEKYLPAFSSLPQKAYDKVAADIVRLNDSQQNAHYFVKMFDCNNPNNFIKVGKNIKIIDDLSATIEYGNVSDMMRVFLRDYGAKNTPNTIEMKKNIFKKCVVAAVKNNMLDKFHALGEYIKFANIKEEPKEFAKKALDIARTPNKNKIKKLNTYLDTL